MRVLPASSCVARLSVAALVALAAAGCGSTSSPSNTPSFRAQANAACRTTDIHIRALSVPRSNDLGGVAHYATELMPLAKNLTDRLQGLNPPAKEKVDFQRYVRILRSDVSDLKQLNSAATAAKLHRVEAIAGTISARGGSDIARRLGLTVCAERPQPQGT